MLKTLASIALAALLIGANAAPAAAAGPQIICVQLGEGFLIFTEPVTGEPDRIITPFRGECPRKPGTITLP